jgi:cellobiose transport system substrate-binding protein
MRVHRNARRWPAKVRLLAVAVVLGVLAAGCGSDDGSGGKIRLTVGLFGDFGYQDLYKKYMADHPNIQIVERVTAFADHHKSMAAHLATGQGANDIEAIETSFIAQFKAQPQHFVDHNTLGAASLQDRWLPWKWQQSLSKDGKQIGLGTDVGGLAMCYRVDKFRQAGLPTDRRQVAALWPDWKSYVDVGKRFEAKRLPATHWYDSGGNLFSAIMGQAPTGFYDTSDNLVVATNPAVKGAWDTVMEATAAGESANLPPFSNDWNTGFQKGAFATITCPAWMMGYIQDQAKDSAGKWDIASVPGEGGNWGGSYLTVPKQSKHQREAYDLAAWLTAPEQQAFVFKQTGNFPSQPGLYADPAITAFTNPFFNNAPVGQIFTASAKSLRPQYLGPKTADIDVAIDNGIARVEQGKQRPDAAWSQVLADVQRLTR